MTEHDDFNEEDEVTAAAGSDLIAQIREDTQDLRRSYQDEPGEAADALSEDVTVWRAAEPVEPIEGDAFQEPSTETDATAVMTSDARHALIEEDTDETSEEAESIETGNTGPATFDGSVDDTAVLDAPARHGLIDDAAEHAATPPVASRPTTPPSAPTTVHVAPVDGTTSLIGDTAPPPSTASYWSSEELATAPKPSTASKSRRRVPVWLLVLITVIIIVGVSVAIALLVASGASN